jgi:peptidoglycan hydrolase CwlO-like protein
VTAFGDLGGTLFFSIVVIILVIALVYLIIYYVRKTRAARMEHVELYFDEHFRDIINEWDLTKRSELMDWKKGMSKRLDTVGTDIDKLAKFRKSFDPRLDKLDSEIKKLEVL